MKEKKKKLRRRCQRKRKKMLKKRRIGVGKVCNLAILNKKLSNI